MDLSNYEQIDRLVRKLSAGMSMDDQDDLLQDVLLKLVKADTQKRLKRISKALVRRVVWQIKQDRFKKKKPSILYDNNKTVEGYSDD
jgi:DNA-directed RNA polymerase specialized sigma24 family protein